MSFLKFNFFVFITLLFLVYYIIPKKYQWICLLIGSYIFYLFAGVQAISYIIFTTITTWGAARAIEYLNLKMKIFLGKNEEEDKKQRIKYKFKLYKKTLFWGTLVANFGILVFLKYFNFISESITGIYNAISAGNSESLTLGLLLPLGISFYTFQAMGYLIDVSNGKYQAEKNIFKIALFLSFFPQIIQGPIGRFNHLEGQLFAEHHFELQQVQYGLQLILWGFFKKLVIADRALFVVNEVFGNCDKYGGAITVFGVLFYSLQQYTDFSGGIDIAMGIAELFGIKMSPNFKRPYFSKTLSEFWRRWHITLGAWMRDYVFYPLALTKFVSKIGKLCSKYWGKHIGKVFPVAFANLVVFIIVGLWHGPYWHYVVWGAYNGLIIATSSILEPFYKKLRTISKINVKSFSYQAFQMIRTFFIINLGWYFDRAANLGVSKIMLCNTLYNFRWYQLMDGTIFKLGLNTVDYKILLISTLVLLSISIMQERGIQVRIALSRENILVRWIVIYALIFTILAVPANSTDLLGGFMYAQF